VPLPSLLSLTSASLHSDVDDERRRDDARWLLVEFVLVGVVVVDDVDVVVGVFGVDGVFLVVFVLR
jgi:hypothetical protein